MSFLALNSRLLTIESISILKSWTRIFFILLGLSTAIFLAMMTWKNPLARGYLTAARIITELLICVPFVGLNLVELYLLTALVIDCSYSLKYLPAAIAIAVAFTVIGKSLFM